MLVAPVKEAKYFVNCSTGPGADSGVKYTVTSDMTTNLRARKHAGARGKGAGVDGDCAAGWGAQRQPTWRLALGTREARHAAPHMSAVIMRLQSICEERELKMDDSTSTSETHAMSLLCGRAPARDSPSGEERDARCSRDRALATEATTRKRAAAAGAAGGAPRSPA